MWNIFNIIINVNEIQIQIHYVQSDKSLSKCGTASALRSMSLTGDVNTLRFFQS